MSLRAIGGHIGWRGHVRNTPESGHCGALLERPRIAGLIDY